MSQNFSDLGLMPELVQTVTELDYHTPTPIQSQAIPILLTGQDVMGQARTGTGKTAAFTLPMLNQMDVEGLQGLILAPTRELAIQVAEAVYRYGSRLGIRVLPVYGQQPYSRQIRRLKKGVHVVVGTPGRTLDLINKKALDLSGVRYLVLDEADEMLKMGFIDDVEAILSAANHPMRQTTLFTATLPKPIQTLGSQYMHNPELVQIQSDEMTVENIVQRYYVMQERDKVAALSRILEVEDLNNTLVFARTRAGAAELAETLSLRGYPAEGIHGDLLQPERERILRRFRAGQLKILVATDVVARGVDIPEVSHVINYDIPHLPIEYVHRIGRTGRAGRGGDAITMVTPKQMYQVRRIEDYTHKKITKSKLPSREDVLARRHEQFKSKLIEQIDQHSMNGSTSLLEEVMDLGYSPQQVATATINWLREHETQRPLEEIQDAKAQSNRRKVRDKQDDKPRRKRRKRDGQQEAGMVRLSMNIGRSQGIRPADIVYGIASQSNIPGRVIGAIDIHRNQTYVDVPEEHVRTVLKSMRKSQIRGHHMRLEKA